MSHPRPSAAHGYDTGAWVPPSAAPSWLARVTSPDVAVRPGPRLPLVVFVVAVALWVGAAGYGAVEVDLAWGGLAAVLGAGGLALVLRGYPLPAVPSLLAAVACWAFVARAWVPDSVGDLAGVVRLVAGTLAFAVPLTLAGLAAVWADGRRTGHAALLAGLADRRWFGVNRGDPEPQLPGLEKVPSARFFALPDGRCAHLVVAGRRAALIGTTVWPRGEFGVEGDRIVRNGRPFTPGTEEIEAVAADVRRWTARLAPMGATCRGFLTVHPASGRPTDAVRFAGRAVAGVQVVPASDFLEVVGGFLAADANTISADVMSELAGDYLTADQPGIG